MTHCQAQHVQDPSFQGGGGEMYTGYHRPPPKKKKGGDGTNSWWTRVTCSYCLGEPGAQALPQTLLELKCWRLQRERTRENYWQRPARSVSAPGSADLGSGPGGRSSAWPCGTEVQPRCPHSNARLPRARSETDRVTYGKPLAPRPSAAPGARGAARRRAEARGTATPRPHCSQGRCPPPVPVPGAPGPLLPGPLPPRSPQQQAPRRRPPRSHFGWLPHRQGRPARPARSAPS